MQAHEIILIIALVVSAVLAVYGFWMKIKIALLEEIEKRLFKEASKLCDSNERTLILCEACRCRRRIEKFNRRVWFVIGAAGVLFFVMLALVRC